jgi:hypothetical protein
MIPETDPAIVSDETVVPPPPQPSEKPKDVPAPEPDEPKEAEAKPEPEAKTEEPEEPDEPRRPRSGYARLKARHQATIAELERLKTQQAQAAQEPKAEAAPKVEDFNGDYLAFERAAVAFEARQAIRDELGKAREQDAQIRQAQSQHEVLDDFFERWSDLEQKTPDAKQAVDGLFAQIGPLNNTLRDLIAEADNGELILYHLAKNPGLGRQLNGLGPIDAAKQIGALEVKMSVPKAKKETSAPPPIKAPSGGATPPSDIFRLAAKSDDISDYVKARKAKKD